MIGLLRDNRFVRDVNVLDSVDSTNDELRRLAQGGAPEGTVVIAESQTGGRGRRGRHWHSPPGLGLYLSVLLRDVGLQEHASRWTLAAAVAVCEACNDLMPCGVTIKWPNDLQVRGKKLAGILAEMRGGSAPELVLGCGINTGHLAEDFPADVAGQATSLALACGGDAAIVDRESLCAAILGRFADVREQLMAGAWSGVAERWRRLAPGAEGQRVQVTRGVGVFDGRTDGIDSGGGLRVRAADGTVTVVHMADSVRPL